MVTSRISPTLFGRNHWMISSTTPISVIKQHVAMIPFKVLTLTAREIKRPRTAYSIKCIRSTQTSKLSEKYVNSRRGYDKKKLIYFVFFVIDPYRKHQEK